MAINRTRVQFVYGIGDNLVQMPPSPVVAQRAPGTRDLAELGTIWIDEPAGAPYFLSSITANSANWVGTSAGTGTFLAVTVNPGDIDVTAGDVNIALGNLAVSAGNATIGGDLTVAGTTTLNGDIDITTAALFDITSTLNAAPSILLEANGGISEQIRLYSNQGTAADSIYLFSNVGGITLRADLATDNAINLTALFGGLDVDCALQINIASSESAVDAIVISALAGGIDITASGTAGEDIDISNSASVNLASSEAVADAVTIIASHAAGGVTIDAGTGGIEIGNTATCSPIDIGDFVPTASRLITIGGGTVTTAVTDRVDIGVDGLNTNAGAVKQVDVASGNVLLGTSTVNINSGTAASGTSTVNVSTGTGGGTKVVNVGNADGLTTVNIKGISNINSSVNANVSVCTGTSTGVVAIGNALAGAVTVDSAAGISLDGAAASNFSVAGAGIDLTLASAAGSVVINGGEAAVDAVRIFASNAAGGIDLDYGTGGMTMTGANGALTVATGTGAINVSDDAAATVVNLATGAAAKTVSLGSATTTSTTTIRSGSGKINLTSAGLVAVTYATDTQASPSAASTVNVHNGAVTFTGFTTAAAGVQVFTITNSLVSTSSPLMVTACNEGAADAQMNVTRVKRAAGSFEVTLINNGAAALNGNVIIIFDVGV